MFSMRNLMDIQSGTLLSQVQAVHKMYNSHIRHECEVKKERNKDMLLLLIILSRFPDLFQ